ncbi:MAG TPA: metal-dependent hydrolase [Candidatus Saccharimonadales bacterium]|nr:metal-dependent hydrolase [Candidatus Saccharimonadales bacterium]
MSGYKGHIVGAVAANTVYLAGVKVLPNDLLERSNISLQDWQLLIGLFVVAILFGLFPDVDTNSVGQNLFFGIAFVAMIVLIVTGKFEPAAYLGLLAMMPIVGKHRGWTHHKLAMVLVPLPIVIIPYLNNQHIWTLGLLIYGAAVAGYFSHLLLDGLIIRAFHIGSRR